VKKQQSIPRALSVGECTFEAHCKVYGFTPVREYVFFHGRRWRFDFAFPGSQIAIEIEGGTWSNGRHTRGSGFEKDLEKYNAAALLGWRVLRYTTDMVTKGIAINDLRRIYG
jgi:hypothetical protein